MRQFLMILMILALAPLSQAQSPEDLTIITVEGTSKADSPAEASREIQAKAMADTAREQVIEIIGDKKYQKNKQLVETKIVRESARFIPFTQPGPLEQNADGYKMSLELKLSLASLKKMIQNTGLLYDSEAVTAMVPMVGFIDRVHALGYRWWTGEKDDSKKFLITLSHSFHQTLYNEMGKQGFYVVQPQTAAVAQLIPEAYRGERPRPEDLKYFGDLFLAPLVLRGEVRFKASHENQGAYQAAIKLAVFQVSNGRSIAEVVRTYDTDAGSFETVLRPKMQLAFSEVTKEIAAQVLEAYQKGTLGANLMQLSVRGRLNPKQLNEFKTSVLKSVKEIKSLRERLFEPGKVTFEVDYAGQPTQFVERFKSVEIPGFTTKLADSSSKAVSLDVKTK